MNGLVKGPKFDWSRVDLQTVLKDMEDAYACGRIVLYAQAFAMITAASSTYQWEVNCSEVARVLTAGNVLRCKLLEQ